MIILTKSEKRGLLFLAVIILASFGVEWVHPSKPGADVYDYTISDSLFDVLSSDTVKTVDMKNQVTHITDSDKKERPPKNTQGTIHKIDINHASSAELVMLPGIGPKTAQKIIVYRRQNGLFQRYDDLLNVDRIGPKTLKKIKPYLLLGKPIK